MLLPSERERLLLGGSRLPSEQLKGSSSPPIAPGPITLSQPSFWIHRTDSCAQTRAWRCVHRKHTRWTDVGVGVALFTPRLITTNSERVCVTPEGTEVTAPLTTVTALCLCSI